VLQQNALAKSLDTNNLKLPTLLLLFVEFNTTAALAILAEHRDFVGGVGQSCGCKTAEGGQQRVYGLLV
jgi:hypothetical protein